MKEIERIAIIGSGPSGAALATHLARAGKTVAFFDPGKRPELLVGESLVPAMIPLLRELGVEEEIARVSTYKPGATFFVHPGHHLSFLFARAGKGAPRYAYNTPRDAFDSILLENAMKAGAQRIGKRAGLVCDREDRSIRLDEESLALWSQVTGTSQPDLIVDATGRARVCARLLDLASHEGGRKDAALFAHVESAAVTHEGHIHINRLSVGWCWRIPLPGRMSLGIVAPHDSIARYGNTAEEQFDALCRENDTLQEYLNGAARITPVMKYTNYQLTTDRWTGPGWALVGDAGGFIDPIFSSGLLLSLEGAAELARAITSRWDTAAPRYHATMRRKLLAWRSLIETFYDGRLFSLFRLRTLYADSPIISRFSTLIDRQLALGLSGAAPDSARKLWLVKLCLSYMQRFSAPSRLRIA